MLLLWHGTIVRWSLLLQGLRWLMLLLPLEP